MSSKGRMLEVGIRERRLRPVYDLLDMGLYKRVIQEVDRLLKKTPDFQCAKAVKALALLRMGNIQEARSIVEPLANEIPVDENSVQALTICYRELGQPKLICTMLDNACKVEKTEDLLTSNFMAHVRIGDYQKQYQIALTLYKINSKSPYFAWAVMSLFIKSQMDPDPSSIKVQLPLAERMMAKHLDEKSSSSEHEMILHILILENLKQYDKVIERVDLLSVHLSSKLTGFCRKAKTNALICLEKFQELKEYLKNEILEEPEDWKNYETYIRTFGISEQEETIKYFDEVLAELQENHSSKKPMKASMMAPIYLYEYLMNSHVTPQFHVIPYLEKFLTFNGRTHPMFSDLRSFFSAVKSQQLKEQIVKLMEDIVKSSIETTKIQAEVNFCCTKRYLQLEDFTNPESVRNNVQYYVSRYLRIREKQFHDGVEWPLKEGDHDIFVNLASLDLCHNFWPSSSNWCWNEAQPFILENSTEESVNHPQENTNETEKQLENEESPNNALSSYISLDESYDSENELPKGIAALVKAVEFLKIEQGKKPPQLTLNKRDVAPLLALTFLHYGVDKSPNNADARIQLAKTYIRCGAVGAGFNAFSELDSKHLMLLGTAYVCTWKLLLGGHLLVGVQQLSDMQTVYNTTERECIEHALSAYKYGSWEKVIEFLKFQQYVLNSVQYAKLKMEKGLLECYKESSNPKEFNTSLKFNTAISHEGITVEFIKNLDNGSDLRDLNLMETFTPFDNTTLNTLSFQAIKVNVQLRWTIFAVINNFALLYEDCLVPELLNNRITKIETFIEYMKEQLKLDLSKFIFKDLTIDSIWEPRTYYYVKRGHPQFLLDLFLSSIQILKNPSAQITEIANKLDDYVGQIMVQEKIAKFPFNVCILDISDVLEDISELIETLCLTTVLIHILGVIFDRKFVHSQPKNQSRKKKSREILGDKSTSNALKSIATAVLNGFKTVEVFLRIFLQIFQDNYPNSWESSSEFWKSSVDVAIYEEILPFSYPIVVAKLRSSYLNSATSWSYLIRNKMKELKNNFKII